MRPLRRFVRTIAPVALVSAGLSVLVNGCGSGPATTHSQDAGGGEQDATSDGGGQQTPDGSSLPDSSVEEVGAPNDSSVGDGSSEEGGDAPATDAADGMTTDAGGDSESDATDSSTVDAGNQSEAGEAGEGGPTGEAGPCGVDGTACTLDGGNGLCSGGLCSPCTDPSSDAACSAAYGDGGAGGYICNAGSCVPGNCRTDAQCSGGICGVVTPRFCGGCTTDSQCQSDATYGASTICDTSNNKCVSGACSTVAAACSNPADICCPGASGNACVAGNCCSDSQCSGAKPACNTSTNTCAACDPVSAGATDVVVDPVNGRDVAGNGSGTVGGVVQDGACAFKTITYALGHFGSGPDGGPSGVNDVRVFPTGPVSAAASGEQFPITVPANVTVEGFGGPVTVDEATGGDGTFTGVAFTLSTAGATLSNLVIDGAMAGVHGVRATTGSTVATKLVNVEVRNFTGAGIRVELSGRLTIDSGTNAHNNGTTGAEQCGLHVTGQAQAFIAGGAVPIQFNQNAQNGILVDGAGSVTITGTPGSGQSGTVVANGNLVDGIEIHQTVAAANSITGLVAAGNGSDGARFYGASSIQVRGSVFVGNTNDGVDVLPEGAGGNTNSVAAIDLGSASSPGGNKFQSGAAPNGSAGICLNIALNQSQTLQAQGNLWEAGDGGALNCAAAGTLTENANKACSGAVDIGGSGLSSAITVTLISNGINASACTCGNGAVCK